MLLSVVVSCKDEAECLPLFVGALSRALSEVAELPASDGDAEPWDFELLVIDDGSSDGTLDVVRALGGAIAVGPDGDGAAGGSSCAVRWVSLARNFGKEAALLAGLERARGGLVAIMDADLQDPPALLSQLVSLVSSGSCDVAATYRVSRDRESKVRSWCARRFYGAMNRLCDVQVVPGARDYRVMRRQVVDEVLALPERNRFTKGLLPWVGFRTTWVPFADAPRAAGSTSWSFWGLARYAVDGVLSFSARPLHAASVLGIVLCLAAFASLSFIVARALVFGDPVSGWPSLASIIVFIGGVQLLCLGVLGEYLAKVYVEVKRRPLYVVRDASDDE